jgi:membrane-bound serine protease (ClpP class)
MKKILPLLIALFSVSLLSAQQKNIMIMEIKSEIDPPMKRYVELAIAHAENTKAEIVIIEMDTYGGILTDAKEIVDIIMGYKKPIWVYVNSDAASAGALISIACDSIYMSPGASIGAATVVDRSGEKAPDKYQSYMRSIMRATAEEKGRDPKIAEGMVDEDLVIEGVKEKGKIISFSTSEAITNGYCEAKVESIEEILKRNNVENYKLDHFQLGRTDKIIAFFMNPFISGLLILAIIAGIYFEMQTPGIGFAGLAALVALILYLVPYYLNGLAENWEIIAFFIGILLIGVEIFVLPGFGVAGISGITVVVGSLVLIMVNNDAFDFEFVKMNEILVALLAALGGLFGSGILFFVMGDKLYNTRFFKRIALSDTQDSAQGYTVSLFKESMIGKKGIAQTVLRPSGKVMIDTIQYDAYTRGEYIDKGQAIEVVSHEGASLKVKLADS